MKSASAEVGLRDNSGAQLELNKYHFIDEAGKPATLGSYFSEKKPVILVPVYFGCPGICNITLNNLVATLKRVLPTAARAFEIVVFSFNPEDTPALAAAKKTNYVNLYERPESISGWHFLTSDAATSKLLANELGFTFEQDPSSKEFNHPAAIYVLSPEGKIAVTFSGVDYPRKDLQRALREATEGKFEVMIDRVSAICYAYMPHVGILSSPKRWAMFFVSLALLGGALFIIRRRRA